MVVALSNEVGLTAEALENMCRWAQTARPLAPKGPRLFLLQQPFSLRPKIIVTTGPPPRPRISFHTQRIAESRQVNQPSYALHLVDVTLSATVCIRRPHFLRLGILFSSI
jgi:hypothetical protein